MNCDSAKSIHDNKSPLALTQPALDFRGTPTGIDIRKAVDLGITPRINTGIAHKNAGVGQVGAGLVRPPLKIFEDALLAYAEKYEL